MDNKPTDKGEWVSVEDRLPDDKQKVLFLDNYNSHEFHLGTFLKKDQWDREDIFCDGAFFNKSRVTHWMPLPSPPNK